MNFIDVVDNKIIGTGCLSYQVFGVPREIVKVPVSDEVYFDYIENPDSYIFDGVGVVKKPQ